MNPAGCDSPALVARVVPDVTGLDKQFDYLVPPHLAEKVSVGSLVRVPLHGRRVGGWVVSLGDADPAVPIERLVPIAKWSSIGPDHELVSLAEWAAARWGAPRSRPLLVAASPPTMVTVLPASSRMAVSLPQETVEGDGVCRITPLTDPLPMLVEWAAAGPMLVVHPAPAAARAVANRLRKAGLSVALMPEQWALAAAGVDVVVGSRGAVWAPCRGLRTLVVLDEHDEALQEERTPTWHARDVALERARRAGARCVLVSPCPTLTALEWAASRVLETPTDGGSQGWPSTQVVDRSDEEPWRRSLLTSELIEHLRAPHRRVVCVSNVTGRARLLACRGCRALQRCERCEAAVAQADDGTFECHRCRSTRPVVCHACGATAMAVVKPGVSRLREELEAAANRPVGVVTGATDELPDAEVLVGTEALLHRVRGVDVVAFLDLDAELLAPRYRAHEHAMALLVRAARLVGRRREGSGVLVQTFVPTHPVIVAAVTGDLGPLAHEEAARRRALGLPPYRALASIEGAGAAEFAAATGLEVASTPHGALVRHDEWMTLGMALAATPRPKGSRLRVEVDPPRV